MKGQLELDKISKEIECSFNEGIFSVKGKLGKIEISVNSNFNVNIKEEEVQFIPLNDNNKALFSSESTDKGNHIVSVFVQDSKGAKSNILNITISIMSQPSVELVCDPEIELNEEAFFTASAFKPQGSIVKYEWDFDSSSRVLLNSIDLIGLNFATHSYNSTPANQDGYIVVVRVTDNDGLTATDSCQIPIVEESSSGSGSSSGDSGGISSQLTTIGSLLGIAIV